MKVDFIIIGAQKCGTTSLASSIAKHPQVSFCLEKEPDFFTSYENWSDNMVKYHKLFRSDNNKLFGEASTTYTMRPDFESTEKKIKQYNPEIKLIYIMRDPVERIISNYAHRAVRKRVRPDLESEIANNPSYISRSRYYYQITPYLESFGSDQVLLLIFEEFISNTQSTLVKVANFLNIDPQHFMVEHGFKQKNSSSNRLILADGSMLGKAISPIKRFRRHIPEFIINVGLKLLGNKISSNPKFPEDLKRALYSKIIEDRLLLENMLGREITHWKRY